MTYGPRPVLTDPFADIEGVEAFIFGSWVARYTGEPGPAPADVDVLVVGAADLDDLDKVAKRHKPYFAIQSASGGSGRKPGMLATRPIRLPDRLNYVHW